MIVNRAVVGAAGRMWAAIQLLACCCLWLTCSTAIVLVNRSIILEGFPYPMALSFLGQATAFLFSSFILWIHPSPAAARNNSSPSVQQADEKQSLVVSPTQASSKGEMSWGYWASRVLPVGVAQGLGIWLSNLLYLLLTVAFIEMARSLMPFLTLLALWIAKLQIPTNKQISAVVLSAVGCGISAFGETKLVALGVIVLAVSFGIEVARMLMLQYLMQARQQSPWQTVWCMSGPASGTLLFLTAAIEGSRMIEKNAGAMIIRFWPAFLMAASLGIATSYITNIVIQLSSATTVKLLAAVRGPLIVLCGMMLYLEPVAPTQLVGYVIALCGFVWYSLTPGGRPPSATPVLPNTQLVNADVPKLSTQVHMDHSVPKHGDVAAFKQGAFGQKPSMVFPWSKSHAGPDSDDKIMALKSKDSGPDRPPVKDTGRIPSHLPLSARVSSGGSRDH